MRTQKIKPRILLNFVALKSGGGVQVGLDFLSHIKSDDTFEWHLLVTKKTPFDSISLQDGFTSIQRAEHSLLGRLIAELITVRKMVKTINPIVIFTMFGPSPLFVFDRSIKTISGCAYSNLFYPEIDFWKNSGFILKWVNKFHDIFRLLLTKRADLVIFETEDLKNRSIKLRGFGENQACFIMPAVSRKITDSINETKYSKYLKAIDGFKIVLISYYRYHKNIDTLPYILKELESARNIHDVYFILTVEPDHPGTINLFKAAEQLGVRDKIINLEPVPPECCAEIYAAADASILPSTLESFSNNIAESWACSVPLIITDRSWARSLCNNAAIYVKHRDIADTAEKISMLYRDQELKKKMILLGKERLAQYPSSNERFQAYLEVLKMMVTTARKENHA